MLVKSELRILLLFFNQIDGLKWMQLKSRKNLKCHELSNATWFNSFQPEKFIFFLWTSIFFFFFNWLIFDNLEVFHYRAPYKNLKLLYGPLYIPNMVHKIHIYNFRTTDLETCWKYAPKLINQKVSFVSPYLKLPSVWAYLH